MLHYSIHEKYCVHKENVFLYSFFILYILIILLHKYFIFKNAIIGASKFFGLKTGKKTRLAQFIKTRSFERVKSIYSKSHSLCCVDARRPL